MLNINKSTDASEWPIIEDKGAYRVQPAPQPFSIRSESKILANEKGRNQKLRLFNLGNTISGEARWIGSIEFPMPPIIIGITIKKIIIRPCAVIQRL